MISNVVGFQVLMAAGVKVAVFSMFEQSSLVEVYRRFTGACCLHHQGDRPEDNHSLVLPLS
jgi:hypothetical protein